MTEYSRVRLGLLPNHIGHLPSPAMPVALVQLAPPSGREEKIVEKEVRNVIECENRPSRTNYTHSISCPRIPLLPENTINTNTAKYLLATQSPCASTDRVLDQSNWGSKLEI